MISGLYGQSGFNFLTKSFNAEALASGNSIWVSSLHSAQEMLASELASQEKLMISYSKQSWIDGINSQNVFISNKINNIGLGLYYKYYGIDDLEARTSPSVEPISTFSNYNLAVGFSSAYEIFEDMQLGLTYKYLTEKNSDFIANGSAIDMSASYQIENYTLYISLINLNHHMETLNQSKTKIPELNVFGLKTSLLDIDFGLELQKKTDLDESYTLYAYKDLSDWFYFFSAYEFNSNTRSWSAGMRFHWESIILSYGYALHNDLNNMSNIQFGIIL